MKPLRFLSFLGVLIFGLATIGMGITFYAYLKFKVVPGWSSLMVVILFSCGFQLLAMGLLGEYIGRIYIEQKKRPLYLISETIGFKAHEIDLDKTPTSRSLCEEINKYCND